MPDGSISGRLSGVVEQIKDITVKGGSVQSVKVRFNGSVYEVWPPGRGFEVEITNARVVSGPQPNFEVTITDQRAVTHDGANFEVTITDQRAV